MIGNAKRLVVIAPHPDDETLGAGATIARFANEGLEVSILIVSGHLPPLYPQSAFDTTRREAEAAMKLLGVKHFDFLMIPATKVHETPVVELNGEISRFVRDIRPDIVFLPFPDRHIDHRAVFDASVVACRPVHADAPRLVMAYETLSETHWNVPGVEPVFAPECFVDTTDFMQLKREALHCYASQVHNSPSRSIEACMSLAKFRGSQNGVGYAEAFKVVRAIV